MTQAECGRDYIQSLTTKRPLAAQLTPLILYQMNSFYARFELSHTKLLARTSSIEDTASALVIAEEDVPVVFKHINIRNIRVGWDTRPGAQSMCGPAGWCIHLHFQPLPLHGHSATYI